MIGVVLVSHGDLASEGLSSIESVLGHPVPAMVAVNASTDDTLETLRARLAGAVQRVEQGEGTIILTDMFGDSASNVSLSLAEQGNFEVVTGVNLPVLLKVVSARETMTLEALATFLVEYGRSHLLRASPRGRGQRAGGA
jgi:PTS system mannose-specific IIA component